MRCETAEVIDLPVGKPRLLVDAANPDETVERLRDCLSDCGELYDRGVVVRLYREGTSGAFLAQTLSPDGLVYFAHKFCRLYQVREKKSGPEEFDTRLPKNIASTYLDWRGEWSIPVLNGITTAPILTDDGGIHAHEGYHAGTGLWCDGAPDLEDAVPVTPKRHEAESALQAIPETFKTVCFGDAVMLTDPETGEQVVDISKPPGQDESAFLIALMTGVCRPSLDLAPGILLRAPSMSGAGAGKGLVARCIAQIAFGHGPHAVTGGSSGEELEKRLAAELIAGGPVLFVDNLNGRSLKSDLLASAITERPARVRVLGRSEMAILNAVALVILTGNGLSVTEDLARRFITIELDPRTEDPEARTFKADLLVTVRERRLDILTAALTIWRWGRQAVELKTGKPLGSFGQWCQWVRDPLLALGCQDPAERISEVKARDGQRQAYAEIYRLWSEHHGDRPVLQKDLHETVRELLDPQGRSRQFVAGRLEKLVGTRVAGFVMTRERPSGKWGAATYALKHADGGDKHRGHRGHGPSDPSYAPYDPYAPTARGENSSGLDQDRPASSSSSPADQTKMPSPAGKGWELRL